MVERGGLENRCTAFAVPWVRIPPPPPAFAGYCSDRASALPAEGCQSGRLGTPGKRVYLYGYRGFESHPLRQASLLRSMRFDGGGFFPAPYGIYPLAYTYGSTL